MHAELSLPQNLLRLCWSTSIIHNLAFSSRNLSWHFGFVCPARRAIAVDIAISYGLDGPGFESQQRGLSCPEPPRPPPGPTQPPIQ
jgi:hypothetical protein